MNSRDDPRETARRRAAMTARFDALKDALGSTDVDRKQFFEDVYQDAEGDPAAIPWADLAPKPHIQRWLEENPGEGKTAIDIACGLGDHAEAMSGAGYDTCAFDISKKAIDWTRNRFPGTKVNYQVADLFNLPGEWQGAFDLVNECYTIQSLPPKYLDTLCRNIAGLVRPGGTLLIYARLRPERSEAQGPPWPLLPSDINNFAKLGLQPRSNEQFDLVRPDRRIPHIFSVWKKPR